MSDQNLSQLQEQAALMGPLEAKLQELKHQRGTYNREVFDPREALRNEQEDVEKLEGRSLANYFFQVIGRLDEKLDRERQEAYAAKVKLDTAQRELAGVEEDILLIERQLSEARVARMRYQEGLAQKRAALTASGTAAGEQILGLEQKITDLQARMREIKEAVSAGRSARITADRILSKLESADGWNTWDLLGGGGIITHLVKHSHLDEAQDLVSQLQSDLRRFRTELADIQISADVQVSVEGFLRFADYFFDGLFADWAVGNRISQSQSSVSKTKSQIEQTMRELERMEAATEQAITLHKQQLDELIVKA